MANSDMTAVLRQRNKERAPYISKKVRVVEYVPPAVYEPPVAESSEIEWNFVGETPPMEDTEDAPKSKKSLGERALGFIVDVD